ncbi:MAG: phosphoribosyltransferase [Betaproteobacteria bacterium]
MGILIEDSKLRDRRMIFNDRAEAGRLLAAKLGRYRRSDGMVLAIPAGGVPVAVEIADVLDLPMDLIVVRKVQVPYNTEVGFGAMDPEGGILFNEPLLRQLALSDDAIQQQIEKTRKVIEQRNLLFREGRPFPSLGKRTAVVVDDGLASGYTLKAAIRYVRRNIPSRIIAAVPTGSEYSVNELLPDVDELVCLNVRSGFPFAVAEAYRKWHDVRDEEVLALLKK